MLRPIPGALHSVAPPVFRSPVDVFSWVWATRWLVRGERAALLHLDDDNRLMCVASTPGRLSAVGSLTRDILGSQTLECGTSAVVAVDVRRTFSGRRPSETDRRRHRRLHAHLATYGVALLDTVIVAPVAWATVTGELAARPPAGGLQAHVPERPHIPLDGACAHDPAGRRRLSLWPLADEPA